MGISMPFKSDGSRIWKTKFPTGSLGGVVSLFITENDKLIVGANGKMCCMNLTNGKVAWVNKMLGFGNEKVSILTTPKMNTHYVVKPEQIHAPVSYNNDVMKENQIIISCSRGKVMAIDIETGNTLWTYSCPGSWDSIPVAIIEPASIDEDKPDLVVYVGAGQWMYCLKCKTGQVVWNARISDSNVVLKYMTIATPWSSRLAAESHSAFSQNPVAQIRSMVRHKEKTVDFEQ